MPTPLTIRAAQAADLPALVNIDPIARGALGRRQALNHAIAAHSCWLAEAEEVLGYGILDRSFFQQRFIPLLMVAEAARNHGVASALMLALEAQCADDKLFTSANESNAPMRRLLHKLSYRESGRIDNLDDGDPELVFMKRAALRAG
ncbi:GNAT family N-acetyltransferase [Chromobacterium haemolyticum]|uniref:GNAT family N-acetyltransferase n=1 Tax=Chromobacterium fluminis TaxID=3044269 RepID=A0ABX0LJ78_9NEIS|nr:GNAT family N-acetyltransferase [Chromobacterium haemolyticum]NHR08535.1 GNAT family N-acetyltransferase [Chromobacterium haemolyticum]